MALCITSQGLRAQPPAHPPDTARRVVVVGMAWDSTASRPLAGAVIQLVDPRDPSVSRSTVADSLGRWRVDGVAPGLWVVGFLDPTLDLLGIDSPLRAVHVSGTDSVVRADVGSPGPT
nr:carboxypeptidase-like regulatory domain-containing protein [Candidatus Eremiobacteraeota bacterium]